MEAREVRSRAEMISRLSFSWIFFHFSSFGDDIDEGEENGFL